MTLEFFRSSGLRLGAAGAVAFAVLLGLAAGRRAKASASADGGPDTKPSYVGSGGAGSPSGGSPSGGSNGAGSNNFDSNGAGGDDAGSRAVGSNDSGFGFAQPTVGCGAAPSLGAPDGAAASLGAPGGAAASLGATDGAAASFGATDGAAAAPSLGAPDGAAAPSFRPPQSPSDARAVGSHPPELPLALSPLADAGAIHLVRADSVFPPPVPLILLPDAGAAPPDDRMALADLAPIFVNGGSGSQYADAKAAFDAQDYPEALRRLDRAALRSPLIPEAAYLKAAALFRAGRFAEAARSFLTLADELPALRNRCRLSAALALQSEGALAPAADLFAAIDGNAPAYREAQLAEARLRLALGGGANRDRAQALLASLAALPAPVTGFGRDLGAEALLLQARLDERRGRAKQALRDYLQVRLGHPLSPQAAEAQLALDNAAGRAPVATAAERIARAETILAANRNQLALDELRPLVKELKGLGGLKGLESPPGRQEPLPLACRAHLDLAKALRKLRHHAEALVEFDRVIEGCRGPELADLRQKAFYLAGQSAAVVDPPKARKLFTALSEEFPKSSLADDALFFLADVEARNLADRAAARRTLRRLVDSYPRGDYAAEGRFRLFWLARLDGETQTGLGELQLIGQPDPETLPRPAEPVLRARYWSAEVTSDARALRQLASIWPANYYGDLAGAALQSVGNSPIDGAAAEVAAKALVQVTPSAEVPMALPTRLHAGSLRDRPGFQAGLALLRLGLLPQAAEELGRVDRASLEGPTGRAEPLLLLSLALTRAGDLRGGHAIAKALVESPAGLPSSGAGPAGLPSAGAGPTGLPSTGASPAERAAFARLLFEVAYPRAFRGPIVHWAQVAGVPADLLQGLMREESALDPSALSAAGAIGLCQLMPATGKRQARKLGLGPVDAEALLQPDLNIRLGASYLGDLLKRYAGRWPLAVAAYNAGEGAVDKWLAAAGAEPLDAFVEEIPVSETRQYVKRVLTSAAVYRTLTAPASPERPAMAAAER